MNKKGKSNAMIWILVLAAIGLVAYFYFTGGSNPVITGELVRTSAAVSGGHFTLTYTVDRTGTWGASIMDSVSGGCKFPDGTTSYKTVMLSTDGSTKSIQITAPASGSCTFTGDYQFGVESIKSIPSLSKNI